jgi:hypothetical protein
MTDLYPVSIEDMIGEVERELDQRRQVYARLVAAGRMNRRQADRRFEVLSAVLTKLKGERDAERQDHREGAASVAVPGRPGPVL